MALAVHYLTVMKQNHDPVEMYDAGTVVTASLVVAFAAVGLVLALQAPGAAVVAVGAVALVATSVRRHGGLRRGRRGRRGRQVCIPDTGVCIEV